MIVQNEYTDTNTYENGSVYYNVFSFSDKNRIWENSYQSQVRLTRGDSVNQGVVLEYCNGYKSLCGLSFHKADADTICRQLGYTSAFDFEHQSM